MSASSQSLAGPQSRLRCGWIALALVAMWPSGCGRYVMGTQTLYPPDIKTVYVQMFDSTSFRRGLGERLTEAIVKEIESRTPYKVVNSPDADSVLTGRIVNDGKGVLVNAPTAEPRYLLNNMRVEVSWVDRKGSSLQNGQFVPLPQSTTMVDANSNFAPEIGMSVTTAQQADIDRIAQQIVSLMESPW
jgi:hypothetical protein